MAIRTCDLDQITLLCQGVTTIAQGTTLGVVHNNYGDHSEFTAVYWNETTQAIATHLDHSTDTGICHAGVTPDATDHIRDLAIDHMTDKVARLLLARATHPGMGKRVRSTTTRGKNKGLEGTVTHTYDRTSFDRRTRVTLAKVQTDDGHTFTLPLDKLRVIDPVDFDDLLVEAEYDHLKGKSCAELANLWVSLDQDLARYRSL